MSGRMSPADDMRYPLWMMPEWAREPFVLCLRGWEDQHKTMQLASLGIQTLNDSNRAALETRWFGSIVQDDEGVPPGPELLDMVRRGRSEAVDDAVSRSQRVLLTQAIIMLWSGLETAIEDFLVAWYQQYPMSLDVKRGEQIRIAISEVDKMNVEERAIYVIHQLKLRLSPDEKASIERFENLLKAFGLSSPYEAAIRNTLWELGHLRNILVHRGGIADRRFVETVKPSGLREGDLVPLSQEQYLRYFVAAFDYLQTRIDHLYTKFGWEKFTDEATGQSTWTKTAASPSPEE